MTTHDPRPAAPAAADAPGQPSPAPAYDDLGEALEAVCDVVLSGARLAAAFDFAILEGAVRQAFHQGDGEPPTADYFEPLSRWERARDFAYECDAWGTLAAVLRPLRRRRRRPAQAAAGQPSAADAQAPTAGPAQPAPAAAPPAPEAAAPPLGRAA